MKVLQSLVATVVCATVISITLAPSSSPSAWAAPNVVSGLQDTLATWYEYLAPVGTDMYHTVDLRAGLYTPHQDICDPTSERFLSMPGQPDLGYCVEYSPRPTATWAAARETCTALGRRLPEPSEWIEACSNGLGGTQTELEWASNTLTPTYDEFAWSSGSAAPNYEYSHRLGVVTLGGSSSCHNMRLSLVAGYQVRKGAGQILQPAQASFRCVY